MYIDIYVQMNCILPPSPYRHDCLKILQVTINRNPDRINHVQWYHKECGGGCSEQGRAKRRGGEAGRDGRIGKEWKIKVAAKS